MPIEGYNNDKEYVSDYLRLISAGSSDNNIDGTPFPPLGVEEVIHERKEAIAVPEEIKQLLNEEEYRDAIDCFEIASSIEPSASSLHNLGLIYYETENYPKAATAFEQALRLEDNLAARHIAYAKVQEKLGNDKHMMHELEVAARIEPTAESYNLLLNAYEERGMKDETARVRKKLNRLAAASQPKRLVRPRRVVI